MMHARFIACATLLAATALAQQGIFANDQQVEKKTQVPPPGDDQFRAIFHPRIDGAFFRELQGTYPIESWIERDPDGFPVVICKKNEIQKSALPQDTTPEPLLPQLRVPWFEIYGQGTDPNQPPPNIMPLPEGAGVQS